MSNHCPSILTKAYSICLFKNILTGFKHFWSWSTVRLYLINLHIWAWSKIFEQIKKILKAVKKFFGINVEKLSNSDFGEFFWGFGQIENTLLDLATFTIKYSKICYVCIILLNCIFQLPIPSLLTWHICLARIELFI